MHDQTVRLTGWGAISGVLEGNVIAWRGLRYATALRWEKPQMVKPWKGVYSANSYFPSCPQPPNPEATVVQSEDCLAANVWMPASGPRSNRTLVFLHGGGFVTGSIGPIYAGYWGWQARELAESRGIVVATLAYRLGALGWLARAGGNLGLRDQAVGLRFLRRVLGGAASRLLVFGQSAGANMVMAHLAAPELSGPRGTEPPLFDAAAIFSGNAVGNPLHLAEVEADVWLSLTPCTVAGGATAPPGSSWTAETLACLRSLSVEQVLRAQAALVPAFRAVAPPSVGQVWDPGFSAFGPIIEGRGRGSTLRMHPATAFETGSRLVVPVIVGMTASEARNMLIFPGGQLTSPLGLRAYRDALNIICSSPGFGLCRVADVPEIMRLYPCTSSDCLPQFTAAADDVLGFCGGRKLAWQLSTHGPTFAYLWRWRLAGCEPMDAYVPPSWGPYHMADMARAHSNPTNALARFHLLCV